jgi:hypothetical protein
MDEATTVCSESDTTVATAVHDLFDLKCSSAALHTSAVEFVTSPPSTYIPNNKFGNFSAIQSLCYDKFLIIELQWLLNHDMMLYVSSVLSSKAIKVAQFGTLETIRNNYRRSPDCERVIDDDEKRGVHSIQLKDACSTPEKKISLLNKRHKAKGKMAIRTELNTIKDQRFSNIIHWIVQILKDNCLVPNNCQPCAASGIMNSMHLLVAAENCLPQHFHYDYDPDTFRDSSDSYKGSSMVINYLRSSVTIDIGWCYYNPTQRKAIVIPPMSLFLFRGDLKHAGSANTTQQQLLKFFMYLDPPDKPGFRSQNEDTLYYDEDKELDYILPFADALQFRTSNKKNKQQACTSEEDHLALLAEAVSETIDMR